MKKWLLSSAILATFALFSACGDDVTEVTEVHQDGMAVLDAGLELSKQKCDTTNVGDMLFVTDSSEVFVCDGKGWQMLKGADGKDGVDGNLANLVRMAKSVRKVPRVKLENRVNQARMATMASMAKVALQNQ